METSRYFKVLAARKWVILVVTLVAAAAITAFGLLSPPSYTATAKLRIVPFGTNAPDYGSFVYFDRLASTYSELVSSDVVLDEAEERLGLERLPNYVIETIPQTELLRLAVTSQDPAQAQIVANTLASILVEQNQSLFAGALGELEANLREDLDVMQTEMDALIAEQAVLESQVPRDSARIAEVSNQVAARQAQYNLMLNNYNQARISQSNQANALSIVQNATLPTEPSSTSPRVLTIVGVVLGLVGGITLAFLLEAINPRLYTEHQIEQITDASVSGRIPRIRNRYRRNVYSGDVYAAEAFRRLSANLISNFVREGHHRVLLVTSSIPSEGKSTVAANLALSLARSHQSVALVDCDMRRPAQHTIFEITPNGKTLRNVLMERTPVDEALEGVGVQNLKLIPAGATSANSTELLTSDQMSNLTTHLMEHFDVVILDGPAVLAAPDALVLATLADGVLLVVDSDRITQRTLALANEQLEAVGAEVIGTVVNRVKSDSGMRWRRYAPKPASGRALN